MGLSVRDRMTLQLAATPYRYQGRKVTAARETLGYGETAFYARVQALLEDAEAEAAMPAEVYRLRRLRDARRSQRTIRAARQ